MSYQKYINRSTTCRHQSWMHHAHAHARGDFQRLLHFIGLAFSSFAGRSDCTFGCLSWYCQTEQSRKQNIHFEVRLDWLSLHYYFSVHVWMSLSHLAIGVPTLTLFQLQNNSEIVLSNIKLIEFTHSTSLSFIPFKNHNAASWCYERVL